jgi:hypothetical protein
MTDADWIFTVDSIHPRHLYFVFSVDDVDGGSPTQIITDPPGMFENFTYSYSSPGSSIGVWNPVTGTAVLSGGGDVTHIWRVDNMADINSITVRIKIGFNDYTATTTYEIVNTSYTFP